MTGTSDRALKKTLAYTVRYHRLERGQSQAEVSKNARISGKLYQQIEAGIANPTLETLNSLARAFKITSNRLLQLNYVRLQGNADTFVNSFKNQFTTANLGVCIRTLDGVVLWGNHHISTIINNTVFENAPIDLMSLLQGQARETLRNQLHCERRGMINPYLNFFPDPNSGEHLWIRYYPTLVFHHSNQDQKLFTCVYLTRVDDESEADYYEYCQKLLYCIDQ